MILTELEQLSAAIEAKNQEIKDLQREIDNFELDPDNYEDSYNDMLNDCYEGVFDIEPSRILQECDPIAYRCGLNDYVDGIDMEDYEEYQDLVEALEELESELTDLEEEHADLQYENDLQEEE